VIENIAIRSLMSDSGPC